MTELEFLRAAPEPGALTATARHRLLTAIDARLDAHHPPAAPTATTPRPAADRGPETRRSAYEVPRASAALPGSGRRRWVGVAAATVVLVGSLSVAWHTARVSSTRDVRVETTVPGPRTAPVIPSIADLATAARNTPALIPPPDGYQHLQTTTVSHGFMNSATGTTPMVMSKLTDQWVTATGSGRVQSTQTELDAQGRPKPDQIVGFGIVATNPAGPAQAIWDERSLATMPTTPATLAAWLIAHDLAPADATGAGLLPAIGQILAWPATPPAVRAAAIELLGTQPGVHLELTADTDPHLKITIGDDTWITVDQTTTATVAYQSGTSGPAVTINRREVTTTDS